MDIANNPTDIYFFSKDLLLVDTKHKFEIMSEGDKLSVKNKNINCLFSNLTALHFNTLYNDFHQRLNLDLEPVISDGNKFMLSDNETEKLRETIITSWIYYYTINNLKVIVTRANFTHPCMVDYMLSILDKKYGIDTKEALTLGAKILRQELNEYKNTVQGRRRYYDR